MATNSDAKVHAARRAFESAMVVLNDYPTKFEAGLQEKLVEAAKVLENASEGDLNPIFSIANPVNEVGRRLTIQAVNDKALAEADKAKEDFRKLTEFLSGVESRLGKQSRKMGDVGVQLREKLEALKRGLITNKILVKNGWAEAKEIDREVGTFVSDRLMKDLQRGDEGWFLDREGNPGRFAVPYAQTGLHNKVQTVLAARPSDYARYQEIKSWRDQVYDLLSLVRAPLGYCQGDHAEEKPKLLWHQDKNKRWVANDLCGDCHRKKMAAKQGQENSDRPGQDIPIGDLELDGVKGLDGIRLGETPLSTIAAEEAIELPVGKNEGRRQSRQPRQPREEKNARGGRQGSGGGRRNKHQDPSTLDYGN